MQQTECDTRMLHKLLLHVMQVSFVHAQRADKFIALHQLCDYNISKQERTSVPKASSRTALLPRRKACASEASNANASDQTHTSQTATGTVIQYMCFPRQSVHVQRTQIPRYLQCAIAGTSITSNGHKLATWILQSNLIKVTVTDESTLQ